MFRYVVSYDRLLSSRELTGLTKHERVYFYEKVEAEKWLNAFRPLANNCSNFVIKDL